MKSKKVTVINQTGLHARPGSTFVGAASKFESKIQIKKLDGQENVVKEGNAKSIVMLLSMGLSKGTTIEIEADGADEQEAVEQLTELVASGLGEE